MTKAKKTENTGQVVSDILTFKKDTKGTHVFEFQGLEGENPEIGPLFYISKHCKLENLSRAAAIKITVEVVELKDD